MPKTVSPTSTSSVRAPPACAACWRRPDDDETALGSDVMSAALEGYTLLKVSGKSAGLDALRRSLAPTAKSTHTPRCRETPKNP